MDFQGKRVLITGADGFIGSHLAERLCHMGADVRAMVCYNPFGHWGWLDDLPPEVLGNMQILMSDVRDPHAVLSACEDRDMIFHLAALIGIPYSYHSPDSYLDTNARGTLNILQAARRLETPRILVTSTSEVYGTARYVPIDEAHPRQGQSPYSASKIAGDALATSFYSSFGLPVLTARPFNTYGPRQSARAVIPTIITQLLSGKEEIMLGSLHPTRDLVYVEDTVEGMLRLASTDGAIGQEVNIATGREISVGDLAGLLIAMIKPSARIVQWDERKRPQGSEVERLMGDTRLLQELCGWKPETTLEEGLERTIRWFRDTPDTKRYKPDVYTI